MLYGKGPLEGLEYWEKHYLLSINFKLFSFDTIGLWNLLNIVPLGVPKNLVTKVCTLVQSIYLRTTLWNMETTSKMWDLNYEVESLEKVGFLCYLDAPNYTWGVRGEGDTRNKIYPIYSKEVMHQNRVFKPISTHTCTIEPSWHQNIYTFRLVLI